MTAQPVASVVLDNEAAQALLAVTHPKHRAVLAVIAELTRRAMRGQPRVQTIVPTAVRVEAGWDRSAQAAANANRIVRPVDRPLSPTAADRACQFRAMVEVSLVDACVAEAFESAPQPAAVVTSDRDDMETLRGVSNTPGIRVVGV